jgi:trimethylamine--corrinoid protein Co-methyltransferase
MKANYMQYNSPQFRVLSQKQISDIHFASLHILEKTGVAIHSDEALKLLADSGADISNPKRVKIPNHVVEQALRTAPKSVTLYTREGKPHMFLNGTHTYFGGVSDCPDILDPYMRKRRPHYANDTAAMCRLVDFLPNIDWMMNSGLAKGLPAQIAELVTQVQCVLNMSKPIVPSTIDARGLKAMLELYSMVAGGMDNLKARPFFCNSVEPTTPLVQERNALEMSLICAEHKIPNVIFSMLMAGATSPATFAGTLAVANSELLSHLTVTQLKNPGAPVIYGGEPNIMDMRTTIFPYGAPELCLLSACLTEITHSYHLPMFGTAGTTDAKVIGAEAGAEVMYQCLMAAFSGADMVHDVGLMDHCTMVSPELIVLTDEIIEMVGVSMRGVEITDKTLALDLIDQVGPGGNYLEEDHTYENFKKFWVPKLMDRTQLTSGLNEEPSVHCEELLNKRTRDILDTHKPAPLPEDMVAEIKKLEKSWFKDLGLNYEYPKPE